MRDAELDFAALDLAHHIETVGREMALACERIGDAEPLDHGREIAARSPAGSRIGIRDRLRREQRRAERFDRRDVGLERTRANRDPDMHGAQIAHGAGAHAFGDHRVEAGTRVHDEVGTLAAGDA